MITKVCLHRMDPENMAFKLVHAKGVAVAKIQCQYSIKILFKSPKGMLTCL